MANDKFYPALSTLISPGRIPDNLGFIKNGIEEIFDNVFYKNLQINSSAHGDSIYYGLTLLFYKNVKLEIPGTGLSFILNPSSIPFEGTEIPVSLTFKWEILKYISNFRAQNFSGSPKDFFDIVTKIAGLSQNALLNEVISVFISGPNPVDTFILNYNTKYAANPINVTPDVNVDVYIQNVLDEFENNSIELFDIVFNDYLDNAIEADIIKNIEKLFLKSLGFFSKERLEKMLLPDIGISVNEIAVGLELPPKIFRQVDPVTFQHLTGQNGEDVPAVLNFNIGSVKYSTSHGLEFNNEVSASLPVAEIMSSGFVFKFNKLKVDFSRSKNIPEAIADGRPDDFVGVYITSADVFLPKKWFKDNGTNNTVAIRGRNVLIGTGGVSGKLALDAGDLLKVKLGQFEAELNYVSVVLQQNSIIESDIRGTIRLKGITRGEGAITVPIDPDTGDVIITVAIHIESDGDFKVTASLPADGLKAGIKDVLDLNIKSLAFGQENDKFFAEVTGGITLTNPAFTKFINGSIEVERLRIWEDGSIELVGGKLQLKKAKEIELGPAKISITAIHIGTHEQYKGGKLRKYRYIGFDGGVSVSPGGVDASGKGVKLYYSVDDDTLDVFVRLESLTIDIIMPGDLDDPKDANLIIHGFLAIKNSGSGDGDPGPEYLGGIDFALPQAKISGGAAMRYMPKRPSWIVDVNLTLPTAIPITSGLGVYGFRGLFGHNFVADRAYVKSQNPTPPITDETDWFQYYKAKVPPRNKRRGRC